MLLPTTCPVCDKRGPAPCAGCAALLSPAPALPAPPGLEGCAALLSYGGAGRELVARLKYRNARSSVPFLARGMAALAPSVDVVTWAPTTPAHRRSRGFDHAEVLARAVARNLGVPCRPLLRRRSGPAQTGRDAAARRAGPDFVALRPVRGWRILLVDDVVTTGRHRQRSRPGVDGGGRRGGGVRGRGRPDALRAARTLGNADAEEVVVEVVIRGRNVEITERLRTAAEEKVNRLSRHHEGWEHAEVQFLEERNPRISAKEVCEATLRGHGRIIRAKAASTDSLTSLDKVISKLEHQIEKLKSRLISRTHPKHHRIGSAEPDLDDEPGEQGPPRIVKTKQFDMKPMTPEEAALQMDVLGHDFYLFNDTDGSAAVVYRRNDGDIGLIEAG